MKHFSSVLGFCFLSIFIFSGCSSIYKCGDPIPKKKSIWWGKRLKTVITERDTLCAHLTNRDSSIVDLKEEIDSLNQNIASLDSLLTIEKENNAILKKKYSDLQNEKLSDAESFSKALQLKNDELTEKEKELADREKSLNELRQKISAQESATRNLNEAIRNALLGFKDDELSVEVKNGKVYVSMSNKLLFATGSIEIEKKGHDALKKIAEVMKKRTDIDILIEGHTDNVPVKSATTAYKDNWDLSVMRATSIVRILTTEYGLESTRITAAGRGEFMPKADNSTTEGRAANRRTEIILSPNINEVLNMLK